MASKFTGRGPQVVYLNDGAQLAARGGYARTMRENVAYKELLEQNGTSSDGSTVDGSTITGLEAFDALYGRGGIGGGSGDVINVKGFGAKGDGVTNDRDAIADAVASLNGQPGVIYFPPGRYRYDGDYTILHSGARVTGAGAAVSVIVVGTLIDIPNAGVGSVFVNTLFDELSFQTDLPTTPENQTDHDITIDNIGFDFTNSDGPHSAAAFLLARDVVISHIQTYRPLGTATYEGFKFQGCDNVLVSNYTARGALNAVDCWKACTRVKVDQCVFESRTAGGNGGLINWNGIGSGHNDFGSSVDLQVSNTTLWLNAQGAIGLFLDPLGAGARTQEMLISNVTISSRSGRTTGITCRGLVDRLKVRGVSFSAVPGADMVPFSVSGFYSPTDPATFNNVITTTSGSNIITVSWPTTVKLGPGNYVEISSGTDGSLPVIGNGLTLKGYYPIISVSETARRTGPNGRAFSLDVDGPVVDPQTVEDINLLTVMVPDQSATSSGTLVASTHLRGYFGHPHTCDFEDLSFDGIKNNGGDLLTYWADSARIAGVMVTQNYQGSTTPQYRAIVAIQDAVPLKGDAPGATNISGVVGTPGTMPLQAGWDGDNSITWNKFALRPIVSTPITGAWAPALKFGGSDSPGIVYSEQSGTYAKTGPMVFFALNIAFSTKGTGTGAASIGGLPFAANSWGGQARGTYTAGFGSRIMVSPSGTTTPIVYSATVGGLTYAIASPGTGGVTGIYAFTYAGGSGSSMTAAANFTVKGVDTVADLTRVGGSGGRDGRYPLTFTAAGAGSGAAGDALVTNGAITQVRLLAGGSGYTVAPTVSFDIPGIIGASVTAVLGTGGITAINVQTRGVYTTAPTVSTAACPGLTGASVTVAVNTTGTSRPMEIVGRIDTGQSDMALRLDVDELGMQMTSSDFGNTAFLHMTGWYLSDK